MSKLGKKLIESMREVLAQRIYTRQPTAKMGSSLGDMLQARDITITDSCGCVFCDIGLDLVDGKHPVPAMTCQRVDPPQ